MKKRSGREIRRVNRASDSRKVKVEEKFWRLAVESAMKQPRLAFYSPISSIVLNYWKNVIPRFSISELLAKIVEKEIANRWPQLYIRAKRSLSAKGEKKI